MEFILERKIRLVHVTSSLRVGGAESVLCDLVEGLSGKFEQVVVYVHSGPNLQRLQVLGVPTYQVKGVFFTYDPFFFIRLYRVLKKCNPDVIHSLLWSANVATRLVARSLGAKIICAYHNNVDQDGAFRNLCDRLTIRRADDLIAVSDDVAQSMRQNQTVRMVRLFSPRTEEKRITVIKNGIDAAEIVNKAKQAQVEPSDLGLLPNNWVIGSVGRFEPVKNYPLLLEAFAKVYAQEPRARLVLVGQGSQEQALKEYAKVLCVELSVIFIVGKSAYGYYPLFDCFVQSSDKEGVSIALLEAISCRIPCIATTLDGRHPVLTNGQNGLLVPAGNAAELAKAIIVLMCDRILKERLVNAAQDRLESDFTRSAMVGSYKKLFS